MQTERIKGHTLAISGEERGHVRRGAETGLLSAEPVERLVSRDKWTPGSEPERAERMRLWCVERGISLLRLALQFCLREGRIHGNPVGNLNIEQMEMNVSAVLEPLPEQVFEEFRAAGF